MIYEFAATQDLHGYDKPWAPGAGINKLNLPDAVESTSGVTMTIADGRITLSGISTAYHMKQVGLPDLFDLDPELYNIGAFNPKADDYIALYFRKDNSTICSFTLGAANRVVNSWGTGLEEFDINKFGIEVRGVGRDVNGFTTAPMIYEKTLSPAPTAFTPFSNICPPEGFNIWDPYNDEFIQVYAGYVNANTRELYLRPVYKEYDGEELVGPWMSSLDPYAEDTTPTTGAFVIDFGGELTSFEITPFMLQTLLDSLGIRQHFTDGAGLLNSLMDQAQGRVRSEEELLHLSRPLKVIAIGDQLPAGLTFKPISKDVLPGLPGKFIR